MDPSLLARHAVRHPRRWLILVGLVTIAFGAGLARLELRTDGGALRPHDADFVIATERDRVRFRDPRQVVLLVSTRGSGAKVASPEGFRFLSELQRELRQLPAVRTAGVLSLPSLPKPDVDSVGFSVGTFLDEIPDGDAAFERLLAEVRGERLTDGLLLSPDGRHAAFYVPLADDRPVVDLIDELEVWRRSHGDASYLVRLTGPEMAEATLGRMVIRDLVVFVPVMVAVIAVLLFVVFRNLGGVMVPMVESVVVLIWTFGAMGWLGVPVTLVTTILPVVLMAMSIADEIHLLEHVHAHASSTPQAPLDGPVKIAIAEVGRPIVATSVTTALGFLSFLSASIEPLRQFGAFTAFGILAAMVLSFTWIPALIVTMPRWWFCPRTERTHMPRLSAWAVNSPHVALAVGLTIIAAAIPGLTRLRVQDSWVDNFAADDPIVEAETAFNDAFWGSYRFDVVFEAEPELFYTPLGAMLIEEFTEIAADAPNVVGVVSYLDPLRDVADALGRRGPLSAMSRLELADVATVAEMSENRLRLRQLLTDGGDAVRARLFVTDADYARALAIKDHLDRHVPALADQYDTHYHYSGDLPAAMATVGAIVENQVRSIGWTLVTVLLALLLFFEGARAASIAMGPVMAAVVVVLGGMGYAGMPLGIASSMFAALTVGVGVDFGVHILDRYRRECKAGLDERSAIAATFDKTGHAVASNAFVLTIGFLVLTFSSLKPDRSLGILLASAMIGCYAATVMLLPRLLRLLDTVSSYKVLVALLASSVMSAWPVTVMAAARCDRESDSNATAVMAGLEKAFRDEPRIVRMSITTLYDEKHPLHDYSETHRIEKTLWGVFNGDADETWLLYTFSGPGRLAGTTLLMQDHADPSSTDGMWLYLRSFDNFTKLQPSSQRVMVPGTALTYEDSRGFIPLDKYKFSIATSSAIEAREGEKLILSCPRNDSIRDNLGYAFMLILVDEEKHVVRRVEYAGPGGRPLKSYELIDETKLGERWYPSTVRMRHRTDSYTTDITYEHWRPTKPPPMSIYRPVASEEKFLPRLRRVLDEAGLGNRIAKELDEADARMRVYEDQLRKHREKRKSTHLQTDGARASETLKDDR